VGNRYGDTALPTRLQRGAMEATMLYWALLFLLVALVAGVLGFGGVASAATGIAQILFFVFLLLFIVSLIRGIASRRGS
jgi:uncharacterized membrane protein YtjA (UPF0391 family)